MEIFERNKLEIEVVKTNLALSHVCYLTRDYQKTLDYNFEALSICQKEENKNRSDYKLYTNNILIHIGNVYAQQRKFQDAKKYFLKALDKAKENNNKSLLALMYGNLGKLATAINEDEDAFDYFNKAIEMHGKSNDLIGIAHSIYGLSCHNYKLKNYQEALDGAFKVLEISEENNMLSTQQNVNNLLYNIYKGKNEYEKALERYIVFKNLSDSLINENTVSELTKVQLQYEFDKKENIAIADKQKMQFKYGLIISILTLGIVITGLLYRLAKNSKKRVLLQNENLEQHLELRSKELTTNVMYIVKKNKLMNDISLRLLNLKSHLKKENILPVQRIIYDLQAESDQDVWKEFELRFQQVHNDFYKNLQDKFPNLTPGEVKLCAFLRLNMRSKEISKITMQNVKTIEVLRSRIRKKFDLTNTDINLVSFLSEF